MLPTLIFAQNYVNTHKEQVDQDGIFILFPPRKINL